MFHVYILIHTHTQTYTNAHLRPNRAGVDVVEHKPDNANNDSYS